MSELKPKVAFVSNIRPDKQSGGFSGMSWAMAKALDALCGLQYVGPISPSASVLERTVSKTKRVIGSQGTFFVFSESRLRKIARETERCLSKVPHDMCFFHGFTPWTAFRCSKPYIAWSDCTFSQYISVFHELAQFDERDLRRIKEQEAEWLKKARGVLFTSRWGAAGAISEYGLDHKRVRYVGNCGLIEPPFADTFAGKKELLFVSTDFRKKGGVTVVKACERLYKQYPDIRLTIVGDPPPRAHSLSQGISYEGFLRKEVPKQRRELLRIFGRAHTLVHPTTADIHPMILIEAGYFGCPSIATRLCGIPEIVDDGVTGILLDNPPCVDSVAEAMEELLRDDHSYQAMRQAVRKRMCEQFGEDSFQKRVQAGFVAALARS